tara:strand:+ start:175 stop:369 length:195 start_codon:yes stop_codon:yes gene_type:complete
LNSLTTFGNEFFRAEVSPYKGTPMYKVEFFSKDDLIFTEYVEERSIAVDTAKQFVKQRERLHGK